MVSGLGGIQAIGRIGGWKTVGLGALLAWSCFLRPATASGSTAFVLLGPEGRALVRVLVTPPQPSCPSLEVDQKSMPMQVRAGPADAASDVRQHAAFPVLACELTLPETTHQVLLDGQALPLPVIMPRRIVVLGDSGCRMKWPDSYQNCSDPAQWPLAEIARSAAADHPDLVIHVGDYHYRENQCPDEGCRASPYGYGWDAWRADFFAPAHPLLQAAPWVMTRGNHEVCARAGQGWFRFLDARAYDPAHACRGQPPYLEDFTEPFAVPLGPHHQLIVFDSAGASEHAGVTNTTTVPRYVDRLAQAAQLSLQQPFNWLVVHHPLLGYGYHPLTGYFTDGAALAEALKRSRFRDVLPANVQMVLQGHIHTFELSQFQGTVPVSLLAGFGGSRLERKFPESPPLQFQVSPGAIVSKSWNTQQFGYVLLERHEQGWVLYEKDPQGRERRRCTLALKQPPYELNCIP